MKCPVCGSPTTVTGTTERKFHTLRSRVCRGGHKAVTFEVLPGGVLAPGDFAAYEQRAAARIVRWKRDERIAADKRPVADIAASHNISAARVRQIQAAMRPRVSARRGA